MDCGGHIDDSRVGVESEVFKEQMRKQIVPDVVNADVEFVSLLRLLIGVGH